jgi:hypothetical protein
MSPLSSLSILCRGVIRNLLLSLLALAAAGLVGCNGAETLGEQPFQVASSLERTSGAVRDGLRRNGWVIESAEPGTVVARLDAFDLRARIEFDEEEAEIDWLKEPGLSALTEEALAARERIARRHLRLLAERIEYFIASADLSPEE